MRHNTYLSKTLSVIILFLFTLNSFAQNDAHQKGKFHKSSTNGKEYPKGITLYSADAVQLSAEWSSSNFTVLESNGEKTFSTGKYLPDATYAAYSPSIELPEVGDKENLILEINHKFKTESYYDFLRMLISTDNGNSWSTVYTDFGKTNTRNNYVDLTRFSGKNIQIALKLETDGSVESDGWDIAEINIFSTLQMSTRGIIQQQRVSSFEILEVYTDNYPESIFVDFTAKDAAGNFVSGLSVSDIIGEDNSVSISSCEKLVESAYGQQQGVDFVFLIDNSGSMMNAQQNLIRNIERINSNIVSMGYDIRYALVRYGQGGANIAPVVEPNIHNNSTAFHYGISELQSFINMWNDKNVVAGSIEPAFWAVETAVNSPLIQFRPGAVKIIILVTDEHVSDGYNHCHVSQTDAINLLVNAGTRFYAITPSQNIFREDFEPLCTATNGKWYPEIYSDFSSIFDDIIQDFGEKYTFRYCPESVMDPIDPNFCIPMELKLKNRQQYGDIACYYPTQTGRLVRTEDTRKLDGVTQQQHMSLSIGVKLLDVSNINGAQVDLYYRTSDGITSPSPYKLRNLNYVAGTDIFIGTIPANEIEPYNVQYFFKASLPNGKIIKSPIEMEDFFAWSFPVDPNVSPQISNVQITPVHVTPGSPVTITADIVDNTDYLVQCKLFYKSQSMTGWISQDMIHTMGNTYQSTIEGSYVEEGILSYFIYAEDNYRTPGFYGTQELPQEIHPQSVLSNYNPMIITVFNIEHNITYCSTTNGNDTIKAYYNNDSGQLQLCGTGTLNSGMTYITFSVFGNDPNVSYKNGLDLGEEIHFKLIRDGMEFTLEYTGIPNNPIVYDPSIPGILMVTGAIGEAVIEVEGNGLAIEHNSIPSRSNLTDFGSTPEWQSMTNTFYIFNRGCEDLTIQDISIADNINFRVNNISSNIIPANGSAYLYITYNAYVSAQTTVSILNNGQVNPFKFEIKGQVGNSKPYILYPNPVYPSDGGFNILFDITAGSGQNVSILVFNSMGVLINAPLTPTNYPPGNHSFFVDTRSLTPGAYIIHITIGLTNGTENLYIL